MIDVAVSGLGAVCSAASSAAELEQALREMKPGVKKNLIYDHEEPVAAGVVDEVPAAAEEREGAYPTRTGLLAVAAAREAIGQSGLSGPDLAAASVIAGSSVAGMTESERAFFRLRSGHGLDEEYDFWKQHPSGRVSDAVADAFGLGGTRITLSTACVSSTQAIAAAVYMIRTGRADAVLAGGSDALCRLTWYGFRSLKVMDDDVSRPFDRNRAGMNLGEAAAFVVLEPLDRAKARGAKALALMAGAGMTADAYHMTAPDPEARGAVRAIRAALDDGGMRKDEVGYINAHGTGTLQNDSMEATAVRNVFGENKSAPAVSSFKPFFGHTLGAAGALEAVSSILCIKTGFLPATPGLEEVDEACRLNHVPAGGVKKEVDAALSNSFAFGGLNTVLAIRRVAG